MQKPPIDVVGVHPTLQVSHLQEAIDFYTNKLGFTFGFIWGEPAGFAGVYLGDKEIFFSLVQDNASGSTVSFMVEDADALYAYHLSNGLEITEPIEDRVYGIRDYSLRDPFNNSLIFGHYIYNKEPSIEIERVNVPLRLEKRLAALLEDIALYKNMSITGTIEEMILHTSEPYKDGVASPHTSATLNHIQELKKKHGIDYDVHGSYRFVEKK